MPDCVEIAPCSWCGATVPFSYFSASRIIGTSANLLERGNEHADADAGAERGRENPAKHDSPVSDRGS